MDSCLLHIWVKNIKYNYIHDIHLCKYNTYTIETCMHNMHIHQDMQHTVVEMTVKIYTTPKFLLFNSVGRFKVRFL